MTKRSQRQVVNDRRAKKAEKGKNFSEKFEDERQSKAKPIVAQTENQKIYLKYLQTKQMVAGVGRAGSGKSYVAVSHAANKLVNGEIDHIYITRPYVSLGKSPGLYPGTVYEKMLPFVQNTLNILKERLGQNDYENKVRNGQISVIPLETLRGMSFKNSAVVIEEFQNTTPDEVKAITTRLEESSVLYLTGDDLQSDIKGENGVQFLKRIVKQFNLDEVGIVEFGIEDIVRSGLTKKFCMIYDEMGETKQ